MRSISLDSRAPSSMYKLHCKLSTTACKGVRIIWHLCLVSYGRLAGARADICTVTPLVRSV